VAFQIESLHFCCKGSPCEEAALPFAQTYLWPFIAAPCHLLLQLRHWIEQSLLADYCASMHYILGVVLLYMVTVYFIS
jgi:hypothetical protein